MQKNSVNEQNHHTCSIYSRRDIEIVDLFQGVPFRLATDVLTRNLYKKQLLEAKHATKNLS